MRPVAVVEMCHYHCRPTAVVATVLELAVVAAANSCSCNQVLLALALAVEVYTEFEQAQAWLMTTPGAFVAEAIATVAPALVGCGKWFVATA